MTSNAHRQGALMGFLYPDGPPWGADPGAYDPEAVERTVEALRPVYGGWFRLDPRGFEHVPPPPAMIVSNHSGGTSVPDAWGFVVAWYRHFGTSRPLHVAAHDLMFGLRASGEWMSRRGVLRADREVTRRILRDWRRDVFVMPGGDHDSWRPYTERYRVSFGGRSGYARLALEERVPIVPVAHAGAHETLVVLSSGYRLARLLGLPRFARAEILPIHLSLPWGLAVGPFPHLPTPARFRWRIGEPVPVPEGLSPDEPPDEALVASVDATVQARIQAMLDDLAAERAVWSERLVDRLRTALRRQPVRSRPRRGR